MQAAEVRPVLEPYVPAGQLSHVLSAVAPVESDYLPVPHWVQSARALKLLAVVPVSALYRPAGQTSHPLLPVEVSYLPEGQVVHSDDVPDPAVL